MKYLLLSLTTLLCITSITAQTTQLEGYVLDSKNKRKLNNVEIQVRNTTTSDSYLVTTDKFGMYRINVTSGTAYELSLRRVAYHDQSITMPVSTATTGTIQQDLNMDRLPGYEFQADVKELLSRGRGIDKRLGKELQNLKIEIYNNTMGREVKVTEDTPEHTFEANFERGNHYTILIRKRGYFAKRIEVNVDIYGCVLCFEGLGNDYAPEIESVTEGSDRGLLVADIPMKKIVRDEAIRLENIYYDFDQWAIRADARPALDKLVQTLRRNPIIIELGSHTDSRGSDDYNMELSSKRAKSAVEYIVAKGIKASRITSKGYGETVPLNECVDGTKCDEKAYQYNRRTEFKVTGFLEASNFDKKSLKQILEEEKKTKKRVKEQIEGI